jgi:hypothetical protein
LLKKVKYTSYIASPKTWWPIRWCCWRWNILHQRWDCMTLERECWSDKCPCSSSCTIMSYDRSCDCRE